MKHILPTVLFLLAASCLSAQYSLSGHYSVGVPNGEMAKNIGLLHSFKFNVMRSLPGPLSRAQLGVEMGIGTYASITKEQTFVFDNGSTTRTNVIYSSNVFQANLVSQVDILQKGHIIPYVKGHAGLAKFYSNVTVEDPKDADGCQPMEKKSLIKDNTLSLGYGAGVRVALQKFCSKMSGHEWIDFSVTRVSGGEVSYINTKRLKDHYHSDPGSPVDPKAGQPVVQRFINATTNSIHEHQVAELFTSPLRMLEFKLGYVIRF